MSINKQKIPSGWLAIDKPCGISSAQIVSIVKRYFKKYHEVGKKFKVGHAGTLDPFASGVLPIAVGEATKTMIFVQDFQKEYVFDIKFGTQTDTLDSTGQVILMSEVMPSQVEVENSLPKFIGNIWQIPPHFSALKLNGKRAYSLARKGITFDLQPRQINIYSLNLIEFSEQKRIVTLKVNCGKGTYIRALARDIALTLGSCAHVSSLRRTKVGLFCEEMLILLANLEQIVHNALLERELRSIDLVLDDIPVLFLSEDTVPLIKNGQAILVSDQDADTVLAKVNNIPIALGTITNGYFKPTKVFNL
jgi:tRNA pseudouridine55 synthase